MKFWRIGRSPNLHGAIDRGERYRLELIIATARAFLASAAFFAVFLDPTEPARYAGLTYILLAWYNAHSPLVLLALLRLGAERGPNLAVPLHAIDLVWAVAITFLTEGPNSPFFPLFTFVLLAAAYRWGYRETMLTGVTAVALFISEVGIAVALGLPSVGINRVLMRSAYFLLASFLLAYLSEQEKGLRAESTVVSRMIGKIRVRDGLMASAQSALDDLLKLFGSRQAFVALEDRATGRVVLWDAEISPGQAMADVRVADVEAAQRADYLFPLPSRVAVWEAARPSADPGERVRWRALTADNKRSRAQMPALPRALAARPWRVMLGLSVAFGDEWTGRLFMVDPTARPRGEPRLRFLKGVVLHLAPVIHNVYLLRRLRSRVGAIERGRVARELHDSVIQSLIGVEMQLDVARRSAEAAPGLGQKLAHIHALLRHEILNVRDLMQQLRTQPTDSKNLVERLSDLVDRFGRDTGIEARFASDLNGVELPPHMCRELTRIVQEGLVNVRKHSGASHVLVRLGAADDAWRLVIEDDGRGFGFDGTLSHDEGAARAIGPRIIRERVEAIGGTLLTTSGPGGARLEITPPTKHG